MTLGPKRLFASFDTLKPSDFVKSDFIIGLLFGGAAIWMAISSPERLERVVPWSIGLIGAVIGTVVAAAAILSAFLDQAFLKKLKRIESSPIPYFAPFIFTAFVCTMAALLLLVLGALPLSTPTWLRATTAGVTGIATGWGLASLLFALDALVGFLELRELAIELGDGSGDEVRKLGT